MLDHVHLIHLSTKNTHCHHILYCLCKPENMEGSNIERNWSPELQPLLQSAGTSVHQGEEDLPPGLVKAKPKNVFLSRSLAIPALVITLAFFFTILMGVRFLVRLNPHVGPHA